MIRNPVIPKLVIPMSGLGSRFVRVGYKDPKPLISVHGKPMIEWVLDMFPGMDDVLFICRREHIETTTMAEILKRLKPQGEIAVIEGAKLGPVDALMKARKSIPQDRPVLVSYCDYYMRWDFETFRKEVFTRDADGAVPCYTGFHPHLLPAKNLYACCKIDQNRNLVEIREKHTFDPDKTKALHSPGVYYFKTGALFIKYAQKLINSGDSLNGEYYASMIYNHMVRDGLKIDVPTGISHFCQWGTPEDLQDYLYWVGLTGNTR